MIHKLLMSKRKKTSDLMSSANLEASNNSIFLEDENEENETGDASEDTFSVQMMYQMNEETFDGDEDEDEADFDELCVAQIDEPVSQQPHGSMKLDSAAHHFYQNYMQYSAEQMTHSHSNGEISYECGDMGIKRKFYGQGYRKEWEKELLFQNWLSKSSTGNFAVCKVCDNKMLKPHKGSLIKHAKSTKHRENLVNYAIRNNEAFTIPVLMNELKTENKETCASAITSMMSTVVGSVAGATPMSNCSVGGPSSASSSAISGTVPTLETSDEPKDMCKTTQFPSSDNKFTSIHRNSLNIHIRNTSNVGLFGSHNHAHYDENLLLNNLSKFELCNLNLANSQMSQLKYKGFAKQLSRAIFNDPLVCSGDSPRGNIANYILNKLNFAGNELMLNLQPKLKFDILGENVYTSPDFDVESVDGKHVMVVSENGSLMLSNEMGECKLSAEILAAAFKNFFNPNTSSFQKDQTIFALRIIGTRFTFYRALVTKSYINSLRHGLPPSGELVAVERYPPDTDEDTFYGFDLAESAHRTLILKFLINLRDLLRNL